MGTSSKRPRTRRIAGKVHVAGGGLVGEISTCSNSQTTWRRNRRLNSREVGVTLRDKDRLASILSTAVFRLDPLPVITSTSSRPSTEPQRPLPSSHASMPVVGVVDGGLTASSYSVAEAWKAQRLVPSCVADAAYGNMVSSLIVQGHDWNKTTCSCRPPATVAGLALTEARLSGGLFGRGTAMLVDRSKSSRLDPARRTWGSQLAGRHGAKRGKHERGCLMPRLNDRALQVRPYCALVTSICGR